MPRSGSSSGAFRKRKPGKGEAAMTQFADVFDSIDAKGNREDLTDMIYRISPTETPFVTMVAGREEAEAIEHEWQVDALAAAAGNAVLEGDQIATTTALVSTGRNANGQQIMRKTLSVSGTQESVRHAGRASELAYQIAKAGEELKRDMEVSFSGKTQHIVRAATVIGQAAGYENWLGFHNVGQGVGLETVSRGTSGLNATPVPFGFYATDGSTAGTGKTPSTPPAAAGGGGGGRAGGGPPGGPPEGGGAGVDGTQRPLTEALLKGVIQMVWTNGGKADVILAGPKNKQNISAFSGNATRFINADEKELIAGIDWYTSDFGRHKIVPSRFNRDRTVGVLTSELWAVAYLRPYMTVKLAKVADAENRMLLTEATLVCRNQ